MKVLILSGHAELAERLRAVLLEQGQLVCGLADERTRALELAQSASPDLLLLDVALFSEGTAGAVREFIARSGAAVLLVASSRDDRLSEVFEGMAAGALDVVAFSVAELETGAAALSAKLSTVAKLRGAAGALETSSTEPSPPLLIAFGASTGGPQALVDVLGALPRDFPAAMVVVQHVDREFAQGFATWLESQTPFPTELASVHTPPRPGRVVVAATNDHLVMTAARTFSYTAEPRNLAYRPSVDVLFRSLARHWKRPGAAVLLTGMGRDGAEGLLGLRRAGWLTLAQDEKTSVVYGMPKAAAELGAADKVLPLAEIARVLARHRAR